MPSGLELGTAIPEETINNLYKSKRWHEHVQVHELVVSAYMCMSMCLLKEHTMEQYHKMDKDYVLYIV